MNKLSINSYDFESQKIELTATITETTALAVAPKWSERYTEPGKTFFAGWNLYAVEGDTATLLETYETEAAAIYVRDRLSELVRVGCKETMI